MKALARSILGFLSVAFAVTGLGFLMFPEQILRSIGTIGRSLGPFAPDVEGRFWLVLAFAYMVLVTVMAGLGAWNPSRFRPMLWVLAIGKLTSSLTALAFFFLDRPAFVYLLNFLVDGGIVVLVGACALLLRDKA
ncbi:MAG: hypothetical protein RMK30_10175 [Anaerolineae bacterium]|nr:hypothetical protein [Anaerolineae bacterium]MDW8103223.1 hypothetical protein [Anaerolineae bacterium]